MTRNIVKLAYEMQSVYKNSYSLGEAVEIIKDKYPEADMNILYAMWYAIDAYASEDK